MDNTTQQPSVVPQETIQASSASPNSPQPKSKLPLIIGLLLLFILISGSAYYLGLQGGKSQKLSQNISTAVPSESQEINSKQPTPTIDSGQIVLGKSYTNTKYGYSLSYPNDWEVNLGVGGATGDDSKLDSVFQIKFNSITIPEDKLTVWVAVKKSTYTDIDNFSSNLGKVQPNAEITTIYSKEKTSLGGVSALKYVRSQIGVGQVLDVTALKDGNEYTVTLEHPDTEPQNITIFNQLLASFKFTN